MRGSAALLEACKALLLLKEMFIYYTHSLGKEKEPAMSTVRAEEQEDVSLTEIKTT